ncbi:MAG: N-acetylmuramoyl-L-alanine amidase [Gemmatimonadaceae bacterium]
MITLLELRPYTGDVVTPSPNHDARDAQAIAGIVLHATADGGDESRALAWLCSPKSRVSCHLLVSRTGRVTRLVGDQQRAWHAGRAWWRGKSDVNSITLGIEIANRNDGEPYTDAQYGRVAAIVAHYCRQGLDLDDVVGHGAIAETRRSDPLAWDWDRFRTMVQHQLRAVDDEGRRGAVYDRRSGDRLAADEAADYGSTDLPPPADPSARAPDEEGRRVPTAPTRSRRGGAIVMRKPVLRSRTLWVNGLTVLAAGSVIIGDTLDLAFRVGLTLPEEVTMWVLFGVGVLNIVLRFQTTCPIGGSQDVDRTVPEAMVRVPARTPARTPAGAPDRDRAGAAAGRR